MSKTGRGQLWGGRTVQSKAESPQRALHPLPPDRPPGSPPNHQCHRVIPSLKQELSTALCTGSNILTNGEPSSPLTTAPCHYRLPYNPLDQLGCAFCHLGSHLPPSSLSRAVTPGSHIGGAAPHGCPPDRHSPESLFQG